MKNYNIWIQRISMTDLVPPCATISVTSKDYLPFFHIFIVIVSMRIESLSLSSSSYHQILQKSSFVDLFSTEPNKTEAEFEKLVNKDLQMRRMTDQKIWRKSQRDDLRKSILYAWKIQKVKKIHTHTQEYQFASIKIELDLSDFVSASDVWCQ